MYSFTQVFFHCIKKNRVDLSGFTPTTCPIRRRINEEILHSTQPRGKRLTSTQADGTIFQEHPSSQQASKIIAEYNYCSVCHPMIVQPTSIMDHNTMSWRIYVTTNDTHTPGYTIDLHIHICHKQPKPRVLPLRIQKERKQKSVWTNRRGEGSIKIGQLVWRHCRLH